MTESEKHAIYTAIMALARAIENGNISGVQDEVNLYMSPFFYPLEHKGEKE